MNLEIVSVDAPSEAIAGETVVVSVFAYNNTSSRIFAIVTADCNGTEFTTSSHWVEPSAQRIFVFSFIMPSGDVTIWCWVWSWADGGWSSVPEDEYGPIIVRLAGVPPEWEFLDDLPFTIVPGVVPPPEWEFLDTMLFTIQPGLVPPEWEFLYDLSFTIVPAIPPPPPPPPLGIPSWIMAAGVIGGALAIGAAIYFQKKKEKT